MIVDIEVIRPAPGLVEAGYILPAGPRGASAYEIAVGEGFTGSVSDWLASFKSTIPGPPGPTAFVDSLDALGETVVDFGRKYVQVAGYEEPGDAPPAIFVEADAEPAHDGKNSRSTASGGRRSRRSFTASSSARSATTTRIRRTRPTRRSRRSPMVRSTTASR